MKGLHITKNKNENIINKYKINIRKYYKILYNIFGAY